MSYITDEQWKVFELCHPDHQGLCYERAAEQMGVNVDRVRRMIGALESQHPDLFTDISSDHKRFDRGVSQWNGRFEKQVKNKF